jgi:muramoyltetrapeptide carboxypeptidase
MNRRNFSATMTMAPLILNNMSISKTITPSPLKMGDTVALITPASAVKPEKFEIAVQNMKNLGLVPKYNDNALKTNGYLAGTDEERINDIHTYFGDKSIKAIWCIRGGYGCTRILHRLDYNLIKKNPKWLIGYSDITALHNSIYNKTGIQGIHGVVASSSLFSPYTLQHTQELLFNPKKEHTYTAVNQSDRNHEIYTIHEGRAEGVIIGGNLSILIAMIGTDYAPSYKNKIVVIEDVGEKPYRIDRMLTQLIHGTDIKQAKAIIFGVFADCEAKPDEVSFTLKETIVNAIAPLKLPSMYGFPFGHVTDITPLTIGAKGRFDTRTRQLTVANSQ